MGILTGNRRRRWRSEHAETADPKRELNQKLWMLRLGVLAAFAALTLQLARLQLIEGDQYEQRAELNQLRIEPVIPSRGLIYDRNGVPVVENVPGFSAAVVAADVPEGRAAGDRWRHSSGCSACRRSRRSLKIDAARKSNDPFTPVIVKDGLDQDAAFRLREQLPASFPASR